MTDLLERIQQNLLLLQHSTVAAADIPALQKDIIQLRISALDAADQRALQFLQRLSLNDLVILLKLGSEKEATDYTSAVVDLLRVQLDAQSVGTLLSVPDSQMLLLQGLDHPHQQVVSLTLHVLKRAVASESTTKQLATTPLLEAAVRFLANAPTALVDTLIQILVQCASHTSGLNALYPLARTIRDMYDSSESVTQSRVLQLLAQVSKINAQTQEWSLRVGLMESLFDQLQSRDWLLLLTALETFGQISCNVHGFSYLEQIGLVQKVIDFTTLSNTNEEDNAAPDFVQSVVIKLIGDWALVEGLNYIQLDQKYQFSIRLYVAMQSNDHSVQEAALTSVGLMSEKPALLHYLAQIQRHPDNPDRSSVPLSLLDALVQVYLSVQGTSSVRITALYALANVFGSGAPRTPKEIDPRVTAIAERLHAKLSAERSFVSALVLEARRAVHADLQVAALKNLQQLALHPFGLDALAKDPGFFNYLVDRSHSNTATAPWKHAICNTLCVVHGRVTLTTKWGAQRADHLERYVREGVYFASGQLAVALQNS